MVLVWCGVYHYHIHSVLLLLTADYFGCLLFLDQQVVKQETTSRACKRITEMGGFDFMELKPLRIAAVRYVSLISVGMPTKLLTITGELKDLSEVLMCHPQIPIPVWNSNIRFVNTFCSRKIPFIVMWIKNVQLGWKVSGPKRRWIDFYIIHSYWISSNRQ